MSSTIKTGFAVLIAAFLFLSPLGACAAMFDRASAPANDCCPAPSKTDCEKTICVCVSTEAALVAFQPNGHTEQPEAAPIERATLLPYRELAVSQAKIATPSHQIYLSLHQFRV